MAAKRSYENRAEAERAEYSTWRAVAVIIPPGYDVPAFRPGHAVPVSHVEAYGYDKDGLVERVTGDAKVQAEQAHAVVADDGAAE